MDFLKKLFTREKQSPVAAPEEIKEEKEEIVAPLPVEPHALSPGLHIGKKSDVGQQREQNEDTIYIFSACIESNNGDDPFGLFIVADGMGGYKKGEIASDMAARTAANYILANLYLPDLTKDESSASQLPVNEVLRAAVIAANNAVLEQVPEAGTTLTIAVVIGHYAYLSHVGDSRAYLYHDGRLQQITQDHSLVARLVELGQATAEEALTHPQRNVLYRAIGQSGTLEVETYLQPLPVNAQLLMCSDGLWGMVPDDEITRILASVATPEDGVEKLIDAANANGGEDNITAILVSIGE